MQQTINNKFKLDTRKFMYIIMEALCYNKKEIAFKSSNIKIPGILRQFLKTKVIQ